MTWRAWFAVVSLGAGLACGGARHARREDGAEGKGKATEEKATEEKGGAQHEPQARHGSSGTGAGARPEAPDEPAEKGVPPRGDRPRVPSAPEALLAPGAVGRIQHALETRGYLAEAHRGGELDAATSEGIRKFQEDEGLAATGMPDRETLDRLGVNPNAAYGREGAEAEKR
jgi:hypothetical protein